MSGNPMDYDSWAREGNYGWSWNEVFPYFLKSEDNRDPSLAFNGYHGRGGPLTVQTSKLISPIAQAFVEAGKYLGNYLFRLKYKELFIFLAFETMP